MLIDYYKSGTFPLMVYIGDNALQASIADREKSLFKAMNNIHVIRTSLHFCKRQENDKLFKNC